MLDECQTICSDMTVLSIAALGVAFLIAQNGVSKSTEVIIGGQQAMRQAACSIKLQHLVQANERFFDRQRKAKKESDDGT